MDELLFWMYIFLGIAIFIYMLADTICAFKHEKRLKKLEKEIEELIERGGRK